MLDPNDLRFSAPQHRDVRVGDKRTIGGRAASRGVTAGPTTKGPSGLPQASVLSDTAGSGIPPTAAALGRRSGGLEFRARRCAVSSVWCAVALAGVLPVAAAISVFGLTPTRHSESSRGPRLRLWRRGALPEESAGLPATVEGPVGPSVRWARACLTTFALPYLLAVCAASPVVAEALLAAAAAVGRAYFRRRQRQSAAAASRCGSGGAPKSPPRWMVIPRHATAMGAAAGAAGPAGRRGPTLAAAELSKAPTVVVLPRRVPAAAGALGPRPPVLLQVVGRLRQRLPLVSAAVAVVWVAATVTVAAGEWMSPRRPPPTAVDIESYSGPV